MKETICTATATRVVELQLLLPDISNLSAGILRYQTPPLPYPTYEIDEELQEYRLMQAKVLEELSESQRRAHILIKSQV